MSRIWIATLVGLVFALLGWFVERPVFAHSWLAAAVTFSLWPLGSLILLLTHSLTGGRWGVAMRPGLLAGLSLLPALPLALLPVLADLAALYPWARPDSHLANAFWLNSTSFDIRGSLYLIVWLGLGALALRLRDLGRVAAPGLLLLALTISFAAIDLTMSLDPAFTSTVYGMLAIAQAGLFAFSAALLFGVAASADTREDLARLLLGLVVLFAYLDFVQLLIVWQADLPREAPWYTARSHGLWGGVLTLMALGHFLLPFGLLLVPRLRRSRAGIGWVAGALVGMEVLRNWWTVLPAASRGLSWVDLACMLGLGGVAIGIARMSPRWMRHA